MSYPRGLRTKLRRLLGRARVHQHHFSREVMRAAALVAGGSIEMNLEKATCDWCLKPFIMPDQRSRVTIISLPTQEFRLDIGGFCWKCREFRCHHGSIWVDASLDDKGEILTREWACETCGTPYSVDSVAAAKNYISPLQRKKLIEQLARLISSVRQPPTGE